LQDYDITLKYLSDKFPKHFVEFIIDGFEGEVTPLDKELPTNKRQTDYLVKVKDTSLNNGIEDFILHIEFQSSHDVDMPQRMMAYYARIVDKHKLPVYPVVVYLNQTDENRTIQSEYMSSIYNEDIMKFRYKVVKVWEIDSTRIIGNSLYGLFPIIPLTSHEIASEKEYLETCFDLVQNVDIDDKVLKSEMLVCTSILAGLKYPKDMIKSLMKEEIMKESVIYQDILNEGKVEGKAEGKAEGMEESIISVLSTRFDNVSANLVEMVHHIKNKSKLNDFLKLAVTSKSISEFEQKIRSA